MPTDINTQTDKPFYILSAERKLDGVSEMINGSFSNEDMQRERKDCIIEDLHPNFTRFKISAIAGDSREEQHAYIVGCNSKIFGDIN